MSEHGVLQLQNALNEVLRKVRERRDEARRHQLRSDPTTTDVRVLAAVYARHDMLDKLDAELRSILKQKLGVDDDKDGLGA